jgi:hypothetical protein
VCFRCFASKKPSEREFFVPAGMDLAVKLLKLYLLARGGLHPLIGHDGVGRKALCAH